MSKKKKNKPTKKESDIVTKESLCAVCALLSLLVLLVLFTKEKIFGQIGIAVHALMIGLFGYFAYPVMLGILYLSVTGMIGVRFIKNRKGCFALFSTIVSIALIVHTATTYSWGAKGYLVKCFNAGANFPKSTVLGWVGGLFVWAISSLTTKVGSIVLFSLLTVLFAYLCYVYIGKGKKIQIPTERREKKESTDTPKEIIQEAAPTHVPPVTEQMRGQTVQTPQRPAFTLRDENTGVPNATGNGFSPFRKPEQGYEDPHKFLFGVDPAENFQRNLLFDPNAQVNKRSPYTPQTSYTEAYQDAVNEKPVQPTKVFTDNTGYDTQRYTDNTASAWQSPERDPYTLETPRETPVIEPIRPIEEEPVRPQEPVSYPSVTEEREEPTWRDYKDYFSPANPNVFGNSEEDRAFAEETFARREEEHEVEDTREEGARLGRDYFDDEEETEDDPYALRSDFDERGRDCETSSREFETRESDLDHLDTRSDRFEEEEDRRSGILDIGRRLDEPVETPRVEIQPAPQPEPPPPPKPRVIRPYVRVPLDDFDCREVEPTANAEEVAETKETIVATLEDFKVSGASIASVTFGPTVSRYNVTLPRSISPKKVVALDQSIAISLHSSGVNIYPNYEDGVVSIEVPNKERQIVRLGSMLTGDTFVNAKASSLMFAMGKDAGNRKVYGDISKMIHLLVAGASGMGKSVFLSSLIISLIYKYSPEELRLILVDPKKTEFVLYNNLPHLMINEIITDVNKTIQSLNWAIGEMNRRYALFEQMSRKGTYVVNLDQYNAQLEKAERLPKIVIIVDELADLMLAAKKDIEDRIQNLTQKARAAGIHLVVATQRPSTDVITGVIKSNLPTRIAFSVATDVDSRVILDQTGAQKLLGMGDFLYTMQGVNTPVRVQSAYLEPDEAQRVINYIKMNNEAYYDETVTAYINNARSGGNGGDSFGGSDEVEPVYIEALRYVILSESASISMIQRKCSVGYNKAGKIVEWMEDMGYISSFDGARARKVLITKEEFESKYGAL